MKRDPTTRFTDNRLTHFNNAPVRRGSQSAQFNHEGNDQASPDRQFGDYHLQQVFCRTTASQRTEAITFWAEQGVVTDSAEAGQRAYQIIFMIRNAADELVGLSTAVLRADGKQQRPLYHFRMFIRAADRVPYLMREVTNGSRDLLRAHSHRSKLTTATPAGMVFVTENRKLMRPGMVRYLERHGYCYQGREQRGLDVWLAPFE